MSLARKEKIQKAIEQKREYLSSLQPGLQNIMQVEPEFDIYTILKVWSI